MSASSFGELLNEVDLIAAPRHVGAPYLTAPEPEIGRSRAHQQSRVVPVASTSVSTHVCSVLDVEALRRSFAKPAPCQAEPGHRALGKREQVVQRNDIELIRTGVVHADLLGEHAERVK